MGSPRGTNTMQAEPTYSSLDELEIQPTPTPPPPPERKYQTQNQPSPQRKRSNPDRKLKKSKKGGLLRRLFGKKDKKTQKRDIVQTTSV
jgi:hypothetical protein